MYAAILTPEAAVVVEAGLVGAVEAVLLIVDWQGLAGPWPIQVLIRRLVQTEPTVLLFSPPVVALVAIMLAEALEGLEALVAAGRWTLAVVVVVAVLVLLLCHGNGEQNASSYFPKRNFAVRCFVDVQHGRKGLGTCIWRCARFMARCSGSRRLVWSCAAFVLDELRRQHRCWWVVLPNINRHYFADPSARANPRKHTRRA